MNSIRQARLDLEKTLYKGGRNVALEVAEQEDFYKEFQKSLEDALFDQVKRIASLQILDSLLLFTKKPSENLITQVGVALGEYLLKKRINLSILLIWAGTQGGQAALDKLGLEGVFGLRNQGFLNYFDDYGRLIINSVDDYTKYWIAGKIQEGKDKGLSPREIAETLIDEGKGISRLRAERIVLTETAKALIMVELEAARRYGIRDKIWRTSLDERVCPICQPLDGKEIKLADTFPGGYDGPPAHVMCRCFIEEVVPEGWTIPTNIWYGE